MVYHPIVVLMQTLHFQWFNGVSSHRRFCADIIFSFVNGVPSHRRFGADIIFSFV